MELALAQYTSIEIKIQSSFITLFSDELGNYFSNKNYGDDIKDITINIICVSEDFEHFFKPKKPKYLRDKKIIENYGFKYETEKRLVFDVKLDFEEFQNSSEEERKKIISREILLSLDTLENIKKKIKDFDWEQFKQDLENYFKERNQI